MSTVSPLIPSDRRILFFRRNRDVFGFLSNFYPVPIAIEGEAWATVEHYYQAQKSLDRSYRELVRNAPTPGQAKRLGSAPELPRARSRDSWFRTNHTRYRDDWDDIKLEVMRLAVRAKFHQNAELGQHLLDTQDAEIVEDSAMDSFWGVGADGTGLNWLGRVLMEIRTELVAGLEGANG